jgi:hypothetical protein
LEHGLVGFDAALYNVVTTSGGMQCVELPHSQLTICDIEIFDASARRLRVMALRVISALISFARCLDKLSAFAVSFLANARDLANARRIGCMLSFIRG